MKRIFLIFGLASTMLSTAALAQSTSTSTSGSNSGANAAASSSPVVTTNTAAGSQSSSGALSGADASNAGNSQNITNNSYIPERQKIVTAPSVLAPALTTTLTETCMGSTTAGVSVLGWGATAGSTWQDHECVRRLNARELAQTANDREAAREVLCGNMDVFRVYNALGRPCRLKPDGSPNPAWTPPPPPPAPVPVAEKVAPAQLPTYTVYFESDSANLITEAMQTLDKAAETYRTAGAAAIVLTGHTDRAGAVTFNQMLSEQRAQAVRSYMITKGIPDEVLHVIAMGETAPAIPTADGVAEARNRRVVISYGPGAGF